MKQNKICYIFSVLIFLILVIFSVNYIHRNEKNLNINEDVKIYLKDLCLDKCSILKCGDYSYECLIPEINIKESQIDEYINNVLETYVEYEVVGGRNVVRIGDFVNVDYSIYMEDELLDSQKDVLLKVGSGFFDEEFERIVIENSVNKEYSIKTNKLSNIISKEYQGKELTVVWIAKEILVCKEQQLTDEFVKKQLGFDSIIEYRENVKKRLEDEEKELLINNNLQSLLDEIITKSEFYINEDQVLEYAMGYVKTYEELANINNLSLEEYIEDVLNMSEESFYNSCYGQAEREIKKILIIGYIAKEKEINILANDIEKYCESTNLIYGNISSEEKIAIRYQIIEDKVLSLFITE